MDIIYVDNTGVVELDGLKNAITGAFENTATVNARIQYQGVDIAGETWPIDLVYVTSSNGLYRGLLLHSLDMTGGRVYTAIVNATAGSLIGEWNCKVLAKDRQCE